MTERSENDFKEKVTKKTILLRAREDIKFWRMVAQPLYETELNKFMENKPDTQDFNLVRELIKPTKSAHLYQNRKKIEEALNAVGFPMEAVYDQIIRTYAEIHNWEIVK